MKILFISHDATRTGAPIVFLHFLRWFKKHSNIPFQILLRRTGELENEFKSLAPVDTFTPGKRTFIQKALDKLGIFGATEKKHFERLKRKLSKERISLIYVNTIDPGIVLEFLSFLKCPVICHIHELEYVITRWHGPKNTSLIKKYTTEYIAVSKAVQSNLITNHQIPPQFINVIYEFIPPCPYSSVELQTIKQKIRMQHKIPQQAYLVCGSGTIEHRKGVDLFLKIAQTIIQANAGMEIHFIWVGGDGPALDDMRKQTSDAMLENRVHFIGKQDNALDFFAASDVFLVSSREDPFPLVMLEAASVGKPIICFADAGGAREFVESDAGFVIENFDLRGAEACILKLLNSPELSSQLGTKAKKKIEASHTPDLSCPKILKIISRYIDGQRIN